MSKELDYINYCIVENECHINRLDTTGYPVEIQKQYSDYLFKKREILNIIKQALTTKSKKEQAFDIIKSDKGDFIPVSKFKHWTYDLYVRWFDLHHYEVKYLLTEEEFNLVKEML
jgi:hypothetical protein